mgnify:CR=1 FL=1
MNKKPSDTREKILATAEKLIYQNGIHAIGMDLREELRGCKEEYLPPFREQGGCGISRVERA